MRHLVIATCLLSLTACGIAGPVKQILSQPADNIKCSYERKQTKWSMDCKADGTVKLEGLPMPLPPLF